MPYELIEVKPKFDGQVIEITIGPAPANIISAQMIAEISAELKRLELITRETKDVKLILFSGEGKHFSYGASVEEHQAELVGQMLPSFHKLMTQMLSMEIPTMAKVSGLCLGGGFELALACGITICSSKAKFAVPEIQLGVFPPPASILLPYKIGETKAAEIVLSGQNCTAEEAFHWGWVNKVVEPELLDETVVQFIEEIILPKSAVALRKANKAVRIPILAHFNAFVKQVESLYLDDLMKTSDALEGIAAFIEKRPAKWTNT
ncbi:MAG: enoyl-CoA hydratase/isomerase family protein [SAR324 cluster bacterium]|nr:enoyl-CoA hydratase/isomerase family protein [SAR324 cluster bacterium]